MEILKSLETYTVAQKMVGINFIITGIGLLIISAMCQFILSNSELTNGLKIGTLVCGIFILIGGVGYKNFSAKTEAKQIEIYNQSKTEFIDQENIRMEKVVKDYPIYQVAFGTFIILSILLVWLTNKPFWHGIAFSIMILFTAVMVIEAFSHKSITDYKFELEKE